MSTFRSTVAAIMNGTQPPALLIPAVEPAPGQGGAPPRRTLRRGDFGDLVRQVQAAVGAEVDGVFGPRTEAGVRALQRKKGLVPDGIVGPRTWAVLTA
jgi:peptidoglycan hydrolase-like protein with peptidoglycan-binding domain